MWFVCSINRHIMIFTAISSKTLDTFQKHVNSIKLLRNFVHGRIIFRSLVQVWYREWTTQEVSTARCAVRRGGRGLPLELDVKCYGEYQERSWLWYGRRVRGLVGGIGTSTTTTRSEFCVLEECCSETSRASPGSCVIEYEVHWLSVSVGVACGVTPFAI
jgi:hypothetical protein